MLYHSMANNECYERQITLAEIQDAFVGCTSHKSSGLDSLFCEFYLNMPDLFSNLLEVQHYCNS